MYNNKLINKYTTEQLININYHLGSFQNKLNRKMNSYVFGIKHNLVIYSIKKSFWALKFLYYNLTELFFERNSFFILGTNKYLPIKQLIKEFEFKTLPYVNINLNGYNDQKWITGVISNWLIVYDFIKKLKKNKTSKSNKRLQSYLEGLKLKKKHPSLPDFVLALHSDQKALKEIVQTKIPVLGFANSNIDPNFYLYPMIANENSLNTIKFFFNVIELSLKESLIKEQEVFYLYLLKKINSLLNN